MIRRHLNLVFVLAVMIVTSACDPIYGVSRSARVAFLPEPAKIADVIRHTPKVTNVKYNTLNADGRPLTFTGLKPPNTIYRFEYHGSYYVHAIVEFTVDYKNRVEYSQYLGQMLYPMPQQWYDETHPVMLAIEKGLSEKCGLTNLPSEVREWSHGIKRHSPAREPAKP